MRLVKTVMLFILMVLVGRCWTGLYAALLDRPVCRDSLLYHHLKAVLPAERQITSANWDGFTSYWSIEEDVFYLDSIRCEHYDTNSRKIIGERIPNDTK